MSGENFISSPTRAMEYIIHLTESGHKDIYCLDVIECRSSEKVFDPHKKQPRFKGCSSAQLQKEPSPWQKMLSIANAAWSAFEERQRKLKTNGCFPEKFSILENSKITCFFEDDIHNTNPKNRLSRSSQKIARFFLELCAPLNSMMTSRSMIFLFIWPVAKKFICFLEKKFRKLLIFLHRKVTLHIELWLQKCGAITEQQFR